MCRSRPALWPQADASDRPLGDDGGVGRTSVRNPFRGTFPRIAHALRISAMVLPSEWLGVTASGRGRPTGRLLF